MRKRVLLLYICWIINFVFFYLIYTRILSDMTACLLRYLLDTAMLPGSRQDFGIFSQTLSTILSPPYKIQRFVLRRYYQKKIKMTEKNELCFKKKWWWKNFDLITKEVKFYMLNKRNKFIANIIHFSSEINNKIIMT